MYDYFCSAASYNLTLWEHKVNSIESLEILHKSGSVQQHIVLLDWRIKMKKSQVYLFRVQNVSLKRLSVNN